MPAFLSSAGAPAAHRAMASKANRLRMGERPQTVEGHEGRCYSRRWPQPARPQAGSLRLRGARPVTEREALLRAIIENPEDDAPRLVFADWLDEHGEPDRAEFIRLQIELYNGANVIDEA